MKTPTPHRSLFSYFAKLELYKIFLLALSLAGLPSIGLAQSTWNGTTSTDWNNAANWTGGVPNGGNAVITTTNPRIATITSTISGTPVDIQVGTGAGVIGQVNHISGNAFTGNGNWMFLGFQGGQATYNMADTTTTGGTFTGYGQGSGNLYVGGITSPTGNLLLGLDGGTTFTLNINSSGTLRAGYLCVGGTGANSGTVNLDNGTVNISGQVQIGGDQYGQNSGVDHLNMSGGVLVANYIVFSRGDNNASTMQGLGNLTGGTLSSGTWLTLGFAGSSTAFAAVTNSGGTINVNTSGGGNMEMTVFDPMSAYFKQNSGALNLCNSAYIAFGNGGNNSGTATFDQNGGTVTFYSDVTNTVGGTGYLNLGRSGDSGTYTYNLNGGTLTVPSISAAGGSSTFNFNGGTLKPTASTTTFMSGLNAANVMAGGVKIDTTNFNVTIGTALADGGSGGGLTKTGNGILTLAGGYTYTGSTVVAKGGLSLDASQSSSSSSAITVSNAALTVSLNNGASSISAGGITLKGTNVLTFIFGTATSPTARAIDLTGFTVSNTGTNIVNISGQFLVVGQYPLIYTGASVPTNNFKLGPLPTGMVAVLTNSGSSLDLLITASGQSLSWYGANSLGNVRTNWDINTSMNWNSGTAKYLQYSGNSYGDNVTFDDSLYLQQGTNVNLAGRVVPAAFNMNSTLPYSITGTGGIDGAVALNVNNTGSLFLGTSNNYSGGTYIGGTLIVTNNNALGTNTSAVTLVGGTLEVDGNTTSARSITVTTNSSIGVGAGATLQFSGSAAGDGGLTKTGNGILNLTTANAISNSTTVSAGVLELSAPKALAANVTVSGGALELNNANAATNISIAMNVDNGVTFNTGIGTFNVGGLNSANALALTDTGSSAVTLAVGANNSSPTYSGTLSGSGTLVKVGSGTLTLGGVSNTHTGGTTVSGGALYVPEAVAAGTLAPFGTGTVTVNNGALLELGSAPQNAFGSYSFANDLVLDNGVLVAWDGSQRITGNVNIASGGGTLGSTFDAPWEGFAEANFPKALFLDGLLTGTGNLTVQDQGNQTGNAWNTSCAVFTSDGTAAQNTYSGTVTVNPLTTGGSGGSYLYLVGTNVMANATIALTGDNNSSSGRMGISSLLFGAGSSDGSGYCTIGGLSGRGSLLLADTILSVGGSGYSTGISVALTVGYNNSTTTYSGAMSGAGSLVKVGTGTLNLTGANTYTGNTTITGGTLEMAQPSSATTNSTVSIASGAKLKLDFASNSGNRVAALVLNGVTQANGVYNTANTSTYLAGTGNLVVGPIASNSTNITFSVSGSTLSLSWPMDHLGWILQTQTNSLSTGLGTNWVDVSGSESITSTNIAISPANPSAFYRLRSP